MTGSIDPYYRWLAISPKHQPPDHYRLLGLELFERDPEVIRDAAHRQIAHVRTYQLGQHADLCQRILNELAGAKACLLDPVARAEYDRRLQTQLAASVSVATANTVPDAQSFRPIPSDRHERTDRQALLVWLRQNPMLVVATAAVAIGIVFGSFLLMLAVGRTPQEQSTNPRNQSAVQTRAATSVRNQGAVQTRAAKPSQATIEVQTTDTSAGPVMQTAPVAQEHNLGTPTKAPAIAGGSAGISTPATEEAKLITNSIGMKLVLIPAGKFTRGSHPVRITKPFYLGATEVTQEQYERVMGENPSKFKGDALRPVEMVSWETAEDFCRCLSEQEGKTYRLPTEAEWEYACRAGSTTKWCFGDEESRLGDYAWYSSNSDRTTHPVGQKKANAWGLYDMHGNVFEWCADWYGNYEKSPTENPTGPASGKGRVERGGGWDYGAGNCLAGNRDNDAPGSVDDSLGFRVALVPAVAASE